MAHTCYVSTTAAAAAASSLRLGPTPSLPSPAHFNLSLPLHSRKPRKLRAGFSTDHWSAPGSGRRGIWSIREDLDVPTSYLMGDPHVRADWGGGPFPSPMVADRFQSVISQLFQYRIVRCGGPVDDDMANIIVAQLLYLDALDPTKDIIMYINSPGGSVTAGMAIFDTMRHIRCDVSTVCVGLAASMAAFLLSAGTVGKRYSLPNARIMIHQPMAGVQGQQTEVEIQGNEILHHRANLGAYLAYHTGQNIEKINEDTEIDFFMSPKEAEDYGLIDSVITNPLKALSPLAAGKPTPAPIETADAVPPAEEDEEEEEEDDEDDEEYEDDEDDEEYEDDEEDEDDEDDDEDEDDEDEDEDEDDDEEDDDEEDDDDDEEEEEEEKKVE